MDMVERVSGDVNDRIFGVEKWDVLTEEKRAECRAVVRMVIEALRREATTSEVHNFLSAALGDQP